MERGKEKERKHSQGIGSAQRRLDEMLAFTKAIGRVGLTYRHYLKRIALCEDFFCWILKYNKIIGMKIALH